MNCIFLTQQKKINYLMGKIDPIENAFYNIGNNKVSFMYKSFEFMFILYEGYKAKWKKTKHLKVNCKKCS